MKARKAALLVAAVLAFGCAHAAPVVQATLTLGNNTQGIATDPANAVAIVTNFDSGTVGTGHELLQLGGTDLNAVVGVDIGQRRQLRTRERAEIERCVATIKRSIFDLLRRQKTTFANWQF
jgi:hypothetical protein